MEQAKFGGSRFSWVNNQLRLPALEISVHSRARRIAVLVHAVPGIVVGMSRLS